MTSIKLQPVAGLSCVVTLNDGVVIPLFGLGSYLSEHGDNDSPAENAVVFALQNGYKLIDTAQGYRNEEDVGRGVKRSGVKREDVFIVTKVTGASHGYEETTKAAMESLEKLQTPYIDLYLIHSPGGGKNIETYQALLDLKKKGLIRSVGVSNFGIHHLEALKAAGLPLPSVNQIELQIFQRKQELVDYCLQQGIFPMGYSPLSQGTQMNDPDVMQIAKRLNKTYAQVMIRWSVQKGYITIPKSVKPERILENAQVFDFELTEDDFALLNTKPQKPCGWDPTISPWEG